jgi:hypothetical protein
MAGLRLDAWNLVSRLIAVAKQAATIKVQRFHCP